MAITRAQQVRQMYKRGTGLGGNRGPQGPAGGASAGGNYGGNRSGGVSANNMSGAGDGPSRSRIQNEKQQEFVKNQIKDLVDKQQEEKTFEPFETLMVKNNNFPGFIGMGLNALKGPRQKLLDRNIDFFRNDPRTARAREKYGLTAQGYKDYMSARQAGNIDAAGNTIISGDDDNDNFIPVDTTFDMESGNMDQGTTEEEPFEISRRFRAEGGSIMPRLSDLSGNVSSAEQMLQEINQRLQSAESTLGEGGATQQPASLASDVFTSAGVTGGPQVSDLRQIPIGQPGLNNSRTAGLEQLEAIRIGSLPNNQFNVDPMSGPLQPALPDNTYQGMEGFAPQPGGAIQSPLQSGGLMQLQGSSGIPAAGYADGGNVVGGEYDFDSARQMYGLGKLVKKVTRSVKKIAKSPIGKAALLYTGLGGLGSLAQGGSFFTNFANPLSQIKSVGSIFAKGGLDNIMARTGLGEFVQAGPGKAVLEKNFLGKVLTSPTALISAGSAIAGLLTPEQESEAQKIADETGIDIAEIRANPDKYLARRFRAEGGSMDEPVAKKTMPLLDMDGQEMDLRAEGGFVPIGRMEKADDVPARLSKNEFVFTAEAVRNAGEGDVDKGAEVMYNMMKNLESGGEVSEESQGLEGAREMFQTSQRLEEVI